MVKKDMKIKYKDKPMNRKKLFRKVITAALVGVAFGITFCITLYLCRPMLKAIIPQNKESEIVLQVGEDENAGEEKIDKNEVESDTEELQYALYNVGAQVNKSLVGINLRSSEGFEGEEGNTLLHCGVIFAQTDREVLILTTPNAIIGHKQGDVTFYADQTVSADLVGTDKETGISVLSVPLQRLSSVTRDEITIANLGNSDILNRGQYAIAIGSPLGQIRSIVTGYFSSVNSSKGYVDMEYSKLKTDIIATPNTNGFLMNKKGAIVGVILQEENEDGEGVISALAISGLAKMIEKLCNNEPIPYLGMKLKTIGSSAARLYGITEGIFVQDVEISSPAAEAGIHKGDIIIGVNRAEVRTGKQLGAKLMDAKEGDEVTFVLMRASGGKYKTISRKAKVGERP